MTMIQQENMPVASGLIIGAFNMLLNTTNTLLFVCSQTSASTNGEHFPQSPLIVGTTLYVSGILIEWLSEQQRHAFKKNPANKGRLYEGGLFSLSRHINYFGYTLWRTGYALAAGGWGWGATVGAFFTYQFAQGAIPAQQHYLEERVSTHSRNHKHLLTTSPVWSSNGALQEGHALQAHSMGLLDISTDLSQRIKISHGLLGAILGAIFVTIPFATFSSWKNMHRRHVHICNFYTTFNVQFATDVLIATDILY